MTRMQSQKQQLLSATLKNVKALVHLTGNNEQVTAIQQSLEALKEVI